MKYIALFLFALALAGASSCKKNYTCYCTNPTAGTDTSFTIEAANSTQAVNDCYSQTLGGSAYCVYH